MPERAWETGELCQAEVKSCTEAGAFTVAKSILSSSLFGTLSGSAVANVVATGSITIPMMKKSGYPSRLAGAIEAVTSTRGPLTPPGMGATAVLVREILRVAYVHNALDQIRGEASSLQFFSAGQFRNPMVVRIASLAYQKGFGGHFHNDNSVGALRDIPGVALAVPARGDDAARMLRLLSGRTHRVATGVAVVTAKGAEVAVEVTGVRFATLSDAEIAAYVATGEPMDKAGAYAIQGLSASLVGRTDGAFLNVGGFPASLLVSLLADGLPGVYGFASARSRAPSRNRISSWYARSGWGLQ